MKWKTDIQELKEMLPVYERLYEKKAAIQQSRPLPAMALQKIKEDLTVEWTYNSNSIEGNTAGFG